MIWFKSVFYVARGCLIGMVHSVGSALDHISQPPEFEPRRGHTWRVFPLWLRFITFVGCLAHLAYHVQGGGFESDSFQFFEMWPVAKPTKLLTHLLTHPPCHPSVTESQGRCALRVVSSQPPTISRQEIINILTDFCNKFMNDISETIKDINKRVSVMTTTLVDDNKMESN